MSFFQKIFLRKEREKMSLKRIALLTALSSVLCVAADTNMTEQAKVWNDKLTEVIDLRKKALQDYNECLDRAGENNITAQEICKETLKMQGEELDEGWHWSLCKTTSRGKNQTLHTDKRRARER